MSIAMFNLIKNEFVLHCMALLRRFYNPTFSSLLYVNSLTRPLRQLRIKTWIRVD